MKLKLTHDLQDMMISVERIDVDYRKVSNEKSKEIVKLISDNLPFFSPRVLSVIIRDIERYRTDTFDKRKDTLNNWLEVEDEAVKILKTKYNIETILDGIYTDFEYVVSDLKDVFPFVDIEIPDEKLSEFLKDTFDYAFGRHTYSVGETIDFILKNKSWLTPEDKSYMCEKIKNEKEKWDDESPEKVWHSLNGYDLEQWMKFKEKLDESFNPETCEYFHYILTYPRCEYNNENKNCVKRMENNECPLGHKILETGKFV